MVDAITDSPGLCRGLEPDVVVLVVLDCEEDHVGVAAQVLEDPLVQLGQVQAGVVVGRRLRPNQGVDVGEKGRAVGQGDHGPPVGVLLSGFLAMPEQELVLEPASPDRVFRSHNGVFAVAGRAM